MRSAGDACVRCITEPKKFPQGLKPFDDEVLMPELKSLCENSKMKPSAAKAALNFPELRHG